MSKSISTADRSSTGIFSFETIKQHIEVPDRWNLVPAGANGQFAGYDKIGRFLVDGKNQGYLLSDPEYRRICCVLYPPKTSFFDTRIKASSKFNSEEGLKSAGGKISNELELCPEENET